MLNVMLVLIKYLFSSFTNAIDYKHGALTVMSIPIALTIEFIFNGSFLGISVTFMLLMTLLIIGDFFTGIIAAKHLGEEIRSDKLSYTFYKAFSYVIFFWILQDIDKMIVRNEGWIYTQGEFTNAVIRNFIFVILILREFISIGENLQKRFGTKPYIFVLANKITDIIENKFIKKIADSDICVKDKKDEPKKD
jgi:hypothetical protein